VAAVTDTRDNGGAAFQPTLQCDTAGCDHVQNVADITEDMIGTPCPKCGASLLTKEDFEASRNIFAMAKILEAMGMMADPATADENSVRMSVHHHNGDTTIKISDPKADRGSS